MKLKNLKISFIGDSITQGACASTEENQYVNIIANKYGAICNNYGFGGTTIAKKNHPVQDYEYNDYCSRIDSISSDSDVIVVFGGTNDFGHGDAAMGTNADRTPETFYGACHYLFSNLLNKFPFAKIVVITPLHRLNENNLRGEGKKEKEMYPLKDYVKVIREVAEHYSLPLLDLFACSGLQPEVEVINQTYFHDGLHPNDLGHRILADQIAHFVRNLV